MIGGAPCVIEDQERARSLCPVSFDVIAVNLALPLLIGKPELPFAVVSAHGYEFGRLIQAPDGVERHEYNANGAKHNLSDYCWTGGGGLSAGSSSLCAAVIAKMIGFDPVVLCGVPLSNDGYAEKYGYSQNVDSEFNTKGKKLNGTLLSRHSNWATHFKAGNLTGIYSMSGKTRQILGEPPFKELG